VADIRVSPDIEQLSRAAANLLSDRIAAALRDAPRATIALSGGSTPRRLYTLLGEAPWRDRIDRPRLHVFIVDERFVPPDHEDSNQRLMRETLLSFSPLAEANFHPIPYIEGNPDEAARLYETDLRRHFGDQDPPRFDVILLGMGPDGHTASLFPGTDAAQVVDRLVIPTVNPAGGSQRISLTLPVLNAAALDVFLVAGQDKAETLRAVINERRRDLPAALVEPTDGELIWLVDQAAESRLHPPA